MANEFKIKHGFISTGNGSIEGEITITGAGYADNGQRIATRNWATQYLSDNSYATTTDISDAIDALVASAPGTLDTLNELAAALGDDPNFSTTITNSIATKLPLAGGTMSGDIRWTSTGKGLEWVMNTDGAGIKFYNTGDADTNSRLEYYTTDNGNEYHRFMVATNEEMTIKSDGVRVTNNIYMAGNIVATQSWVSTRGYGQASDITAVNTRIDEEIIPLIDTKADVGHNHDGVYLPIAGKAADSDKLDGINSTSFLRSDADDTMTGNLTMSSATPTLKFSINGAENNAGIVWEDGDAGDPSAQAAAIKWNAADNNLRFYNNDEGAERMRINSTGVVTFLYGIDGLTNSYGISGNNFNITGVNELKINDPGEGINFHDKVILKTIDDATDNKIDFTGATEVQVNGAKLATETWVGTNTLNQAEGDARYDPLGSANAIDIRINEEVLPAIPTNVSELTNDAGYITDGNTGWNNSYGFITASDSITGNAATATKLATARNIALSGAVTGNANFDGSGNITIATTATSDPTLTLAGDASGSATFTNLGNATLTVTVANDSHTHDGRYYTESESDARFVNVTGDTVTGDLAINGATLSVTSTAEGTEAFFVDGVNGRLFTISDDLSDSLFSANTISGLPVIEAFADNTVKLGPYSNPVIIDSTGSLTIGGATAATQSYVDTSISNLIGGAPGALDTLNELAAAINDDASFASSVTSSLALKAPLASPALTGNPTAPTQATSNNSTRIATTAFVKAQGYVTTDTNYYLNGISRSGNVLTFSVNGATNQTYTFGSAAWAATTDFDAVGSADTVSQRIDNEILPLIETPAITSDGNTPSLNSGISAAEIRSLIGAQVAGTYLTSYTETDTLDSVTSRGATTTNAISAPRITLGGSGVNGIVNVNALDGAPVFRASHLGVEIGSIVRNYDLLHNGNTTQNGDTTQNGNINLRGNLLLTGPATTTNQGRMIDFTGFDKEGTTDFSDRAYIQHTTNTGGHSGSVLVISSQNDSGDGIAFLTNASSKLKHNGNNIATESYAAGAADAVNQRIDNEVLPLIQVPAITSNGSVPALNSGITAAEVRSLIGAGTSSSDTNYYLSGASFNTSDGVLTLTVTGAANQTVDLDGRYQLAGSYLTTTGKAADSNLLDGLDSSVFMRKSANSHLAMNNYNISGVNHITINDPGYGEGIQWGNMIISESPDDLSNQAGNLHIANAGDASIRVTIDPQGNLYPSRDRLHLLGKDTNRWQIVFCEILDSAGQHEKNLQNPEGEKSVSEYETGTVLVWKGGKNVPCVEYADHMRMGIAVKGIDSPLIQGAEPVLVTGVVKEGDYLITSRKEGHAEAISPELMRQQGLYDCVLGKALENGEGESYLVKTWINI